MSIEEIVDNLAGVVGLDPFGTRARRQQEAESRAYAASCRQKAVDLVCVAEQRHIWCAREGNKHHKEAEALLNRADALFPGSELVPRARRWLERVVREDHEAREQPVRASTPPPAPPEPRSPDGWVTARERILARTSTSPLRESDLCDLGRALVAAWWETVNELLNDSDEDHPFSLTNFDRSEPRYSDAPSRQRLTREFGQCALGIARCDRHQYPNQDAAFLDRLREARYRWRHAGSFRGFDAKLRSAQPTLLLVRSLVRADTSSGLTRLNAAGLLSESVEALAIAPEWAGLFPHDVRLLARKRLLTLRWLPALSISYHPRCRWPA